MIDYKKLQMAEQLRRALQMFAASLPEEQALEVASIYPNWELNKSYKTGEYVTYGLNNVGDPQLYKVVQDHTSQADWLPSKVASLYDPIGLTEEGYTIWSQPSGAHDAYYVGDIVEYNGVLYKSLLNGNCWSPNVYPAGWEKVEESTVEPEEPEEPSEDYPEWVQPTGAHDAYNTGDIVSYNGQLYKSLIDGNTWAPDVYPQGWEAYTPE